MIYPRKISANISNKIITILKIVSIIVSIFVIYINNITITKFPYNWSLLVIASIIYCWIIIMYSIKRNINIAGHILIHEIILSIIIIYIDYMLGFKYWSLEIGLPIIFICANCLMLLVTIISYKKYIRYAIFQLLIVALSIFPLYLILEGFVEHRTLSTISLTVSFTNLIITFVLTYDTLKEAIIRRFHI